MVFLAAATGLRVSELLGLKWSDIEFGKSEISLARGIVHQNVGEMKTEASRKPIAMVDELADALRCWNKVTVFNRPEDWVFASPEKRGEQPYWPENPLRRYIRPAAKRAGSTRPWASTRSGTRWATLMNANGENVKIVQEVIAACQ